MQVSLYYYSGAGNTKFIAKKISENLKDLDYKVSLMKITNNSIINLKKSDMYIVGFPVYDLTSPQLVKDLIINLEDKNKPISFFCTKAFASAEAIKELSELSNKQNLQVISTMELYMPATDALVLFAKQNSWIEKILKFFHSRNIDKKINEFVSKLLKSKPIYIKQKWYTHLSFLIPQKIKNDFHAQYTKYIPQFYSQTDICIECMKCVKECPRDNIRFDEYIKFDLNCDMCLHCVHHCPTQSIQIGSLTQGNTRYNSINLN
jgi:ferredoxin/menaquinone-dependent protoporphyrinogen IX oxidase